MEWEGGPSRVASRLTACMGLMREKKQLSHQPVVRVGMRPAVGILMVAVDIAAGFDTDNANR